MGFAQFTNRITAGHRCRKHIGAQRIDKTILRLPGRIGADPQPGDFRSQLQGLPDRIDIAVIGREIPRFDIVIGIKERNIQITFAQPCCNMLGKATAHRHNRIVRRNSPFRRMNIGNIARVRKRNPVPPETFLFQIFIRVDQCHFSLQKPCNTILETVFIGWSIKSNPFPQIPVSSRI